MWKTNVFFKSCFAFSRTERFSLTAKEIDAMKSISSMLRPDRLAAWLLWSGSVGRYETFVA